MQYTKTNISSGIIIILLHFNFTLAALKKKPDNWEPRRRLFTTIEATRTYEDGKTGTEAELAFYTRKFKFTNHDRDRGGFLYLVIKRYIFLKSGHELHYNPVPLDYLNNMSAFLKAEVCRKYLNEPLMRYNRIFFDENASLDMVSTVEKKIEFHYHNVPSTTDTFIQCPISVDMKPSGFLFMTMLEKAENEHEDHFYMFTEVRSGVVAPLMRSKYNSGSLLVDIVGLVARTAEKCKDKFLDYAVGEIPDDCED